MKKKAAVTPKTIAKNASVSPKALGRSGTSETISESQSTSNIISIREYGAHGDGKSDDTGAFQSAINFLQSKGGGIVTVPVGDYALYDQLVLYPGVTIQGGGWNTILRLKKNILPKSALYCDVKGSNITLSKLRLETEVNGFGVEFKNVDNVLVKEVYMAGGWFPAIWIFDGKNPIVEDSLMDKGGSFVTLTRTLGGRGVGNRVSDSVEGFDINEECTGFLIQSNQFIRTEEEAVDINGSKDIIVNGNRFEACNISSKTSTGAIHVTGTASGHSSTTENIRVQNNTFIDSRYSAIRLSKGDANSLVSNILIERNNISVAASGLTSYGVKLYGSVTDVKILGNSVAGAYRAFESFDSVSYGVVLDSNIIRNSKLEGIDISYLDSPKLYNNEIYNSGVNDSSRSNISIRNSNTGTVLIRGGVLSNAPKHAVMTLGGTTLVEDVDVSGNKVSPFFIADSASLLSRGCKGYINYFFGTNSPSNGRWEKGDRIFKETLAGDIEGWICTASGWANKNGWKSGTTYLAGNLVNNVGRVYRCIVNGGGTAQVGPNHLSGTSSVGDGYSWEFVDNLAVFRGMGQSSVRAVSSNVTLSGDDEIILMSGSAPLVVTLPSSHESGKKYTFKDSAGNGNLVYRIIQAATGQTIDGAGSMAMDVSRGSITIVSDGANWHIIN